MLPSTWVNSSKMLRQDLGSNSDPIASLTRMTASRSPSGQTLKRTVRRDPVYPLGRVVEQVDQHLFQAGGVRVDPDRLRGSRTEKSWR